ncbi:MAG: phosphate/phosphite/phosphonate ABC transporter substrate-binding protein, partial [Firmicutes bacterium]|nr:phosphate/phosphite/phosphonate ABC transporter substrate-binding protein [Bacillota bacterium]
MFKRLTSLLRFAGVLSVSLLTAGTLMAQECPRGDLDSRFCDRNGDLVADAPTNSSDWVNPNTLIFAYTPVEDPAVYKTAWSDFLTHMESVTGKKVVFF